MLEFEKDMLGKVEGALSLDPLLKTNNPETLQAIGPFLDKLRRRLTYRALLDGVSPDTTLEALDKLNFNTSQGVETAVRDLAAMLPGLRNAFERGIYDREELLSRATRDVDLSEAPNGLFSHAIDLVVEAYLKHLAETDEDLSEPRRQRLELLVGADYFSQLDSFARNGHPFENSAPRLFGLVREFTKAEAEIPDPPNLSDYPQDEEELAYEVEINGRIANNIVNTSGNADLFGQLNRVPIGERIGATFVYRPTEAELEDPRIQRLLSEATSLRGPTLSRPESIDLDTVASEHPGLSRFPDATDADLAVPKGFERDTYGDFIPMPEKGKTDTLTPEVDLAFEPTEPAIISRIDSLYDDDIKTEPSFMPPENPNFFDRACYRLAETLTPKNLLRGLAFVAVVTAGGILDSKQDSQPEQDPQAFYTEKAPETLAQVLSIFPKITLEDRLDDGGLIDEDLIEKVSGKETVYLEPTPEPLEAEELSLTFSNPTFTNRGSSLILTPEENNSGLMVYTLAALSYGDSLTTMSSEELQLSLEQTKRTLGSLDLKSRNYIRFLAERIAEDNPRAVLDQDFTRAGVLDGSHNVLSSSRPLTITYDDILEPIKPMNNNTLWITVSGGRGLFSYLTTIASNDNLVGFSGLQNQLDAIDSSSVVYGSAEWESARAMLEDLAETQADSFIHIPYGADGKPDTSLTGLSQENAYAVREGTTFELELNTEPSGTTGSLYQPNLEERIELAKFGSELELSIEEISNQISYRGRNVKPSTVVNYLRAGSSQAMWQQLSVDGRKNYILSRADEGASVQEINSEMGYTDSRARAVTNVLSSTMDVPETVAYQENEEA